MANFVWNPSFSGNFTGSNWQTPGHPGPGDSATLGGTATYLVIADTLATAAYGAVVLSDPNAILQISNPFTAAFSQSAGILEIASALTLSQAASWSGGSAIAIGGLARACLGMVEAVMTAASYSLEGASH